MKSNTTMRKLAVLVTGAALALSFPAASAVGNAGGVPNSHAKPCKVKTNGNGPKKSAPNTKGKKCGFNRVTS